MFNGICVIAFFSLLGFMSLTPINKNTNVIFIDTLSQDTISIDEVKIEKKQSTPLEKFDQKKTDHHMIYLLGDNKDMFSFRNLGLALNLNKLYNHFSKSGKQARKLQRFFEAEYEDDQINEIWKPYCEEFSGLKNDSLKIFQIYYKPTLTWIANASHYERLYYIKTKVKNYLDSTSLIEDKIAIF